MSTNAEPTPQEALSNSERLLQHLKEGSLAARLVQAQTEGATSRQALKAVLTERLEQVRKDFGGD